MTSTYEEISNLQLPLVVSIVGGRYAETLKSHFKNVLSLYQYGSFDEFVDTYPGNTSDFDEAEKLGFNLALKDTICERSRGSIQLDLKQPNLLEQV